MGGEGAARKGGGEGRPRKGEGSGGQERGKGGGRDIAEVLSHPALRNKARCISYMRQRRQHI
jgi:hypothetical protein